MLSQQGISLIGEFNPPWPLHFPQLMAKRLVPSGLASRMCPRRSSPTTVISFPVAQRRTATASWITTSTCSGHLKPVQCSAWEFCSAPGRHRQARRGPLVFTSRPSPTFSPHSSCRSPHPTPRLIYTPHKYVEWPAFSKHHCNYHCL